jgi:excisionase family DNA binding protein
MSAELHCVVALMDVIEQIEGWGRLMSVEELAVLIQCSEKTLYRYVKQRKLPSIRIGTHIRFNPKATAKWLRDRQR